MTLPPKKDFKKSTRYFIRPFLEGQSHTTSYSLEELRKLATDHNISIPAFNEEGARILTVYP
jgi:hypothetical protein